MSIFSALTPRKMLLLLVGVFAGYAVADPEANAFLHELLKLSKNATTGEEIRMAALGNNDWDAFFLFSPYSSLERIEKIIGTKPPRSIAKSGIDERDDINLFVFMKHQVVGMALTVLRKDFDASVPDERQPLNKDSAVFVKSSAGSTFVLKNSAP